MKNRGLVLAIASALVASACGSDATAPVATTLNFKAVLNGAQVVPTNATTAGSGTLTATFDTVSRAFTYTLSYTGLAANVTLGHIHFPAGAGVNSTLLINLATVAGGTFVTGATTGTGGGTVTATGTASFSTTVPPVTGDSLVKLIVGNFTYVDIHTTSATVPEIRGQIIKQP